jgi:hypothetical protein
VDERLPASTQRQMGIGSNSNGSRDEGALSSKKQPIYAGSRR